MTREVLLIEDDPDYRAVVVRRFAQAGYRFVQADSPQAGIRALEANPHVRVVLLDLSFPGSTGTVVLDHIRDRAGHYRVIVLTGHDELLAAERARDYDVFNYLPKAGERSSHQALRFSLDQAFKDLERAAQAQKIIFLQEVQRRINENRDLSETLNLICTWVRRIVGAYTCHIRVYDFDGGDFHLAGFDPDGPLREAFSLPRAKGELFSGRVVSTRESEHFDDLQNDAQFLEFKRTKLEGRTMTAVEAEYWESVSSAYIVPISTGFFGETVDAVLNVSSESAGFFDDDRRALVDEFVQQASLAITKDWLQRKRKELHDDYSRISEMLGDMRDRLSGPEFLHDLYLTVTQKLSQLVNAEVVSIFLYNSRTERIENVAEYRGTGHVETPNEAYEIGQSFVGRVFEMEETLQLQTTPEGLKPADDPNFDHRNTVRHADIIPSGTLEHYLGVPIQAGGRIQGVLRAMNKKSAYYDEVMGSGGAAGSGVASPPPNRFCLLERGFSLDCRNVVEITASHLAIAIQNARLIKGRTHRAQQLQTLWEVGRIIGSELDIQTVLAQTIRGMATVMQAEICMLFLKDEASGRLVLKQCFGIPATELEGASYELGERLTGTVAANGIPQLIERAGINDGKYDDRIRRYLSERDGRRREIESLMVVPIIAKSTPLGVMKVINKVGGDPHYRLHDLRLFQTFGQYVGVAVENANVYTIAERDALLSDLVRAVAHEINNTSGLIPSNVALIREALGEVSPDVDEMLTLIDDVANQATEFANEITGFSATQRGEKRAMNLNDVIQGALRELGSRPDAAPLTTSLAEQPLICAIFATPFKHVVRNIVINAFQALKGTAGGLVTVSTSEGSGPLAGWAVVEFRDNGPGILPEHLEKIFDSHFTTKETGNGIGLWLVNKQLEFVGGTIEVANLPGAGALFTVKIPLAQLTEELADE